MAQILQGCVYGVAGLIICRRHFGRDLQASVAQNHALDIYLPEHHVAHAGVLNDTSLCSCTVPKA